jgi:hypothetical protein
MVVVCGKDVFHLGALRMAVCRLLAILWDAVIVKVVVVATGGVPGWTVVVAAVVVVVIDTISVVGDCCSWQVVAMLEWCVFAGGRTGGSVP